MSKQISLKISRNESAILKGIAIISVLFAHGISRISDNFWTLKLFSLYCESGMFLFLFLSGYGLSCSFKNKKMTKKFWLNRMIKIMLPIIITMTGSLIIRCFFFGYRTEDYLAVFLSLIGVSSENVIDSTMWYVSYLWLWYCFFFLYKKISNNYVRIIALMVVAIMGIFFLPYFYPNAIYCGLAFPLGIFYETIVDRWEKVQYKNGKRIIIPMIILGGGSDILLEKILFYE